MRDIVEAVDASHYHAFLTGRNNFRKKINPEYKANRKDKEPPIYLQDCRDFLIQEWNAVVTEGCEADDMLGEYQTGETIICTLDKDLDTIPGYHYNWNKGIIYEVSELDALKSFYRSVLMGDRSDNIFGIDGIGPVKASKLIDPLETEEEMYNVCKELYKDDKRLCMNMNCLYIWH